MKWVCCLALTLALPLRAPAAQGRRRARVHRQHLNRGASPERNGGQPPKGREYPSGRQRAPGRLQWSPGLMRRRRLPRWCRCWGRGRCVPRIGLRRRSMRAVLPLQCARRSSFRYDRRRRGRGRALEQGRAAGAPRLGAGRSGRIQVAARRPRRSHAEFLVRHRDENEVATRSRDSS